MSLFVFGAVAYSQKVRKKATKKPTDVYPNIPGPSWPTLLRELYVYGLNRLHLYIETLGCRYGHIFGFSCFGKHAVFLNNARLIKEAFACEEFQGRPNNVFSDYLIRDDLVWNIEQLTITKLRKIFHRALGMYGSGVQKFENIVTNEIKLLSRRIEAQKGADFCMNDFIKDSLSNLISILVSTFVCL